MAEHKLRNRLIAAIVYALVAGGTVYGYVRSNGLETEVAAAALADSAREDLISRLTEARDTLLRLKAFDKLSY